MCCISSKRTLKHALGTCLLERPWLLHFDLYFLIIIASLDQSQVHAKLSAPPLAACIPDLGESSTQQVTTMDLLSGMDVLYAIQQPHEAIASRLTLKQMWVRFILNCSLFSRMLPLQVKNDQP